MLLGQVWRLGDHLSEEFALDILGTLFKFHVIVELVNLVLFHFREIYPLVKVVSQTCIQHVSLHEALATLRFLRLDLFLRVPVDSRLELDH